jgi:hypothetical protein
LEDRRNVGESNCNSGDGTDQRVQSLMFMMMKLTKENNYFTKECLQMLRETNFEDYKAAKTNSTAKL